MKVSVTYEFDVPEEMVQTSIDKAVDREVKSQIREEDLIRCENCINSIILNGGRIIELMGRINSQKGILFQS